MSYPYSYNNSQPSFQPNRGYPANNGYNTPPTHNYGYQQPQHQPQQPSHYSGGGYNLPPAPVQNRAPVEAFRGYYADRLRELTFNSRPLIQDLSIMAMQQRDNGNWDNMAGVVEEIEIAVYRSPPPEKLPKLYLLDSISKNIGAPYTSHFLPAIIPRLYIRTFRDVDGVTRNKMTEMIGLWRRSGPNGAELYGAAVREEVEKELFGGRPAPGAASTIPALRTPIETPQPRVGGYNTPPPAATPVPIPAVPEGPTKQEVLDAINTTIQAKHVEAAQKPWEASVKTQLGALMGLSEMVMTKPIPIGELRQIMDQLKGMGYVKQQQQQQTQPTLHAPAPVSAVQQQARAQYGGRSPLPPVASGAPDISSILMGLTSTGILAGARTPDVQLKKNRMQEYEDMVLNLDVQLTNLDLNRFNIVPLDHLPVKCAQCSHRFPSEGADLDAHMDWHVRRNRSERQSAGRGAHRRWLPRADEWEKEIPSFGAPAAESSAMGAASTAGQAAGGTGVGASASGDGAAPAKTQASIEQLKRKTVKVPPGQQGAGGEGNTKCPICKEVHKAEWSEDEEEWVWRNAISINGKIYHATCRAESLASKRNAKAAGLRNSVSGTKSPTKSASPGRTPEPANPGPAQRHPLSYSVHAGDATDTATVDEADQQIPPTAAVFAAEVPEAGVKRKADLAEQQEEERKRVKVEEAEPVAFGGVAAPAVEATAVGDTGDTALQSQVGDEAAPDMAAVHSPADGGGEDGMAIDDVAPAAADTDVETAIADADPPSNAAATANAVPAFTFNPDLLKDTLAALRGLHTPPPAAPPAQGTAGADAGQGSGSGTGGSGIPGFSL